MNLELRVGGEIDLDCPKCKLNLAHTILAMVDGEPVKVRCNTCGYEHKVRKSRNIPKGSGLRARKSRPSGPAEAEATWKRLLDEAGPIPRKRYNMYESYEKGDLIDHPAFGVGIVTNYFSGNKIEVGFRSGPKVLVHNYKG
ncbi:MAG: hypothetical protein GXP49_07600 [Deltaproteobacteria bacterium]|nr:hypothetical protein [Deltaproteobacteria bacterium]